MESSKENDGCQPAEGPILCINNCGFYGSSTTMNMCSKCHKDMILKQSHAQLASSSIENVLRGGSSSNWKALVPNDAASAEAGSVELEAAPQQSSNAEPKAKQGPNRCTICCKRVGLTPFKCKCGDLFCSVHRYADKHACPFDYQAAARDAIAKANPLVKAEKVDKI